MAQPQTVGGSVGGAIDDRAPTFFGLILICIGLLAAYGLVTGTLQNAWAALTGTLTPANAASSNSQASSSSSGSASTAGQSSVGSYASSPAVAATSLGTSNNFASDYVAPNIAQPSIASAAGVSYPQSATVANNVTGQPAVSTPQNIYGALAA